MTKAWHCLAGPERFYPAALSLMLVASGCVQSESRFSESEEPVSGAPVSGAPLRVSNGDQPYAAWDGAAARKAADAKCGAKGVRVSIYDRFDRATGEWVYPGGCA